MTTTTEPVLETWLGQLLTQGTRLASIVVGVGLALSFAGHAELGTSIERVGIALFILLPIARVSLMAGFFFRERDYRYGAIATAVLLIIFLGFMLGIAARSHGGGRSRHRLPDSIPSEYTGGG